MEKLDDAGAVILDEIAALERERARIEASVSRRMIDFEDLRRHEAQKTDNEQVCKLEASFAADELSLVLLQPTMSVQRRLAQARRVRRRLPRSWTAALNGQVDTYRMRLIDEAADRLQRPNSLLILDTKAADYAGAHTPAQLKAWLRRFVARTEPDQVSQRQKRDFAGRCVYVDHDADGTAWLHSLISSVDAARIDTLLTSLAKAIPAADMRTIDQRRADLYTDLLLGRTTTDGDSTGAARTGAIIGVTIPITSLAGVDDTPGVSFDRQFTLPAQMVRELTTQVNTLFYRLLTDPLGHLLDVTEIGRYPSRRLKTALEIRDGTCAFPTCNLAADRCDKDHIEPAPRGPTNAGNLKSLCRRHHRMKTFGIVATDRDADGHRWQFSDGTTIASETYPLAQLRKPPLSRAECDLVFFIAQHAK